MVFVKLYLEHRICNIVFYHMFSLSYRCLSCNFHNLLVFMYNFVHCPYYVIIMLSFLTHHSIFTSMFTFYFIVLPFSITVC